MFRNALVLTLVASLIAGACDSGGSSGVRSGGSTHDAGGPDAATGDGGSEPTDAGRDEGGRGGGGGLPIDGGAGRDAEMPDADGAPNDAGTPDEGFTSMDGLGEGGRARRIGSEYLIAGQALRAGDDGAIWLLWRSYPDPVVGATDDGGGGLYALTRNGGYVMTRLDEDYQPRWASPLLPAVLPPELPPDAPIDELLRASELAHQFATEPVAVAGGVLAAATVTRGTLAALNLAQGLELPLPADPRCADVVIARVSADGGAIRYFSVPTPECERLPKLAVVAGHAVVASLVSVEKPPQPNDTSRIEIAVASVDLETGDAESHRVAFEEDDIVNAIVPCGERACIAGVTGARAVDTGSVVAFGDGFIVPIAIDGELGERWTLTSPRHSQVHMLVAGADAVVFFATVNGPITHTADDDTWLGYNEALPGVVPEP